MDNLEEIDKLLDTYLPRVNHKEKETELSDNEARVISNQKSPVK